MLRYLKISLQFSVTSILLITVLTILILPNTDTYDYAINNIDDIIEKFNQEKPDLQNKEYSYFSYYKKSVVFGYTVNRESTLLIFLIVFSITIAASFTYWLNRKKKRKFSIIKRRGIIGGY